MRSGPKAIQYQGTLFRVSELVWVKVNPLPIWRKVIKYGLMLLGPIFFYVVGSSKGSFWNIEGILGFLAFHIGYSLRGDTRLATSGDLVESYDSRGSEGEHATFSQWVEALGEGADEVKLGSPGSPYHVWFNLQRVAWARPSISYDLYGLTAVPVYLGYEWLIAKNLKLPLSPILQDLKLLQFENGDIGNVSMCCWAIALMGVVAAVTSLARVLEVRACGGLSDVFAVSQKDQKKFFDKMAGLGDAVPARPAPVVVEAPKTPVRPPEPKVAPPPPAVVEPPVAVVEEPAT